MCGIAGIISGSKIDIKKNILKITQSLKHRGPDSNDTWIDNDNGVAFGHTRLSIIDLSFHGNQPMHSHNNRYVIVYNGEIYNFKSLKKYIEESGHLKTNWNSSTDTEIILEYINIFGIKKALNDFNGMFAFAIWDKKEKILILARDKFGEKPLYYGWIDNDFYFSSELSAINQLHKNKLKICHKALSLYTQLGYVPSPLSIYQKISKLQAGQYICLQIENIQKIDSYFYFSPEIQYCHSNLNLKKKIVDDEKNIETFLRKSISEKLVADVPVGVFLSGGIDSSLIAAIAQDEYFKSEGKSIKTFTIGFKDKKYDESVYARKISIHLNTDHHEEILDKNKIINIIPKIPIIYGEPFADYSSIPTYLVSELAKSKVKVALSGDGGDELFGGYSRYIYADYFKSILNKLPLKIILL